MPNILYYQFFEFFRHLSSPLALLRRSSKVNFFFNNDIVQKNNKANGNVLMKLGRFSSNVGLEVLECAEGSYPCFMSKLGSLVEAHTSKFLTFSKKYGSLGSHDLVSWSIFFRATPLSSYCEIMCRIEKKERRSRNRGFIWRLFSCFLNHKP